MKRKHSKITLAQIEKALECTKAMHRMSEEQWDEDFLQICPTLDRLYIPDKGIPQSRMICLYGKSGSAKSTLALAYSEKILKSDPFATALYFDFERGNTSDYIKMMGLDKFGARFDHSQPECLEEVDAAIRSISSVDPPAVVIIDSIAFAITESQVEGDNKAKAQQARLFAQYLPVWKQMSADYGIFFILLNQTRQNGMRKMNPNYIGPGGAASFIRDFRIGGIVGTEDEYCPGGDVIRFACDFMHRLVVEKYLKKKVFNVATGKTEYEVYAALVSAQKIKGRGGKDFDKGAFWIEYGKGIDLARTIAYIVEAAPIKNNRASWMIDKSAKKWSVQLSTGEFSVLRVPSDKVTGEKSDDLTREAFVLALKENSIALQALIKTVPFGDTTSFVSDGSDVERVSEEFIEKEEKAIESPSVEHNEEGFDSLF